MHLAQGIVGEVLLWVGGNRLLGGLYRLLLTAGLDGQGSGLLGALKALALGRGHLEVRLELDQARMIGLTLRPSAQSWRATSSLPRRSFAGGR